MSEGQSSKSKPAREVPSRAQAFVFWANLSLLVLVPLVFSAAVYNSFVLPKFAVLLTGTSASVSLLVLLARGSGVSFRQLKSKHVVLVFAYMVCVSVSAIAGVDPVGSFAGGYRRMGVLTELCFLVCFASLIVGIGSSKLRFERTLWVIALTGAISAAYAVAQSFGGDPFIQPTLYTFTIEGESVVRAGGTLGHSNVLGNFLLYTTPVALGLAFASRGRIRVVALIATALSTAAVILSGTRGAWLGLAIGVAIFLGVARSNEMMLRRLSRRWIAGGTVLAFLAVMGLMWVFGSNHAARGVILRARSIMTEHFTGAGRTLLWRDSIKVVPAAAITGYGPESFTKVFPAFGSMELAKLSRLKSESSHNDYLDVAITEGLLGAALYAAITASTLLLLIGALRRARLRRERFVIAGLVAAFVAVIVHNMFTYDQLSTGLYFFAFAALAQSASDLFEAKGSGRGGDFTVTGDRRRTTGELTDDRRPVTVVGHRSSVIRSSVVRHPKERPITSRLLTTALAVCLIVSTGWYSVELVQADVEINDAFDAARAGDFERVLGHGERATQIPEPTGAYDFLFIQSLSLCIDHMETRGQDIGAVGRRALDVALTHADRASAHTFMPEWYNMLMAHLAIAARDAARLHQFATEAVKANPNHFYTRWLMAEDYLLRGENEKAMREAETALELNPFSPQVASALARARAGDQADDSDTAAVMAQVWNSRPNAKRSVEELIEVGRKLSQAGHLQKARIKLLTAIGRANGPCAGCHRELALVYEKMGRYSQAIVEWETLIRQAPERASAEQIKARVEALRQMGNPRQ